MLTVIHIVCVTGSCVTCFAYVDVTWKMLNAIQKGPRAGWDADGKLDCSSPAFIDGTERSYNDEDERRKKIQNFSRVSQS